MTKVVFAFKPHRIATEVLREAGFEVSVYPGRDAGSEWIEREATSADALVVTPYQPICGELAARLKALKILVIHGSGHELVDVNALSSAGVCVANVPDPIADAVAEHALALALASLRNVVLGDRAVREGMWRGGAAPREFLGNMLRGMKVGIIGLGRVGSRAAYLFKAVGADVSYWSRRRKVEVEHALGIKFKDLRVLLRTSDVIVVSVALTPETRCLIGAEELALMKDRALLINVSRGAVIDEHALVEELRRGRIKAALDVFEEEPLPKGHPLTKLDNVVLTPHIGGYAYEAIRETGRVVAELIVKYLSTCEVPPSALNPSVCRELCRQH